MHDNIIINGKLLENIIEQCKNRFPEYTRGLVVSDDNDIPSNFYIFKSNERLNNPDIIKIYESFGDYYKGHKGFVTSPREMIEIEKCMSDKGEKICGVFHVHIDLPACPTKLDIEMFFDSVLCPDKIWTLIVSFFDKNNVDYRFFSLENRLIRELKQEVIYAYNK